MAVGRVDDGTAVTIRIAPERNPRIETTAASVMMVRMTPEDLQVAEPSIKALSVHPRANGTAIASATGFVVVHEGGHYLITNWHVVAGRDPADGQVTDPHAREPSDLEILHTTPKLGRWEVRHESLYDTEGDPLWLEHPVHGRRVDAVALPLTPSVGVELRAYRLLSSALLKAIAPSEGVSIVGFPFGLTAGGTSPGAFGIWTKGWVATEPDVDRDGLPYFLVDARTRPGQSGSPVILFRTDGPIADDGSMRRGLIDIDELLGVYSGRINAESDLGFVWKTAALEEIITGQHRGPIPKLGPPP